MPSTRLPILIAALFTLAGCTPSPDSERGPTGAERTPPLKVELLVFTAKWCSVCRKVPPLLEKLKREFPDVTFREIDADNEENMKLMAEYEADALPYFVVRIDGRLATRQRGLLPDDHMARFLRDAIKSGTRRQG